MAPQAPQFADLFTHTHHVLRAVLEACEPGQLVRANLSSLPAGPVHLIAFGKASVHMCIAAGQALGERIRFGICTSAQAARGKPAGFPATVGLLHADHPLPTSANVEAAEAVRFVVSEFASSARRGEQGALLALISGGGSSHLTLPALGLGLDDLRKLTSALLKRTATIGEINSVRKHLEQLKGGRLAALAAPGRVLALVLSDVVGDEVHAVASGPLAPDPTTYGQALGVLKRYDLLDEAPRLSDYLERGRDGELEETPKPGHPAFATVENRIIGGNDYAVLAASAAAEALGFRVVRAGCRTTGVSREVGAAMAREALELRRQGERGAAVILGGETTVDVRGKGAGGRNQELALAAALELSGTGGVAVLAFATDGMDGPTDAAGAVVTGETVPEARRQGLAPRERLDDNDAYSVLARLDGVGFHSLFKTGPTGTNVNDIAMALVY